jgi:hypothetical protein
MKNACLFIAAALLLTRTWTASAQGSEPPAGSAEINSSPPAALPGAAQTVFDYYFQIQTALAQDSLDNVAINAEAMAEIARKDTTGAFSPQLASQADAMAKAKDLPAARQPFKAVSGYLIQYLRANSVPAGTYHELYCPMKNLMWLQIGSAGGFLPPPPTPPDMRVRVRRFLAVLTDRAATLSLPR